MGRPKEFDREAALDAARDVFWARGYEATSVDDLVRAMGIGRQSLYDTFGGKRALYLEALGRYNAGNVADLVTLMRRAGSPMEALRRMLFAEADLSAEQRALGCMGVNAICEFGQSDPDVVAAGAGGALLERALIALLADGFSSGEFRADLDARAAARFIQCTLSGLKVSSKAGAPPVVLRDIASFALNSLKAG